RERVTVGADRSPDGLVDRDCVPAEFLHGDDQWWIADYPRLAVDQACELGERSEAVLRPRVLHVLLRSPSLRCGCLATQVACQVFDVEVRVPQVQVPHGGELPNRPAVGATDFRVDLRPLLRVEAAFAPGDREACRETLDVPLERTGKRFVEVGHAEDE